MIKYCEYVLSYTYILKNIYKYIYIKINNDYLSLFYFYKLEKILQKYDSFFKCDVRKEIMNKREY